MDYAGVKDWMKNVVKHFQVLKIIILLLVLVIVNIISDSVSIEIW